MSDPLNAEGLIERAKGLGVDVVQIADNLPLREKQDAVIRKLAKKSSKNGISLELGTWNIESSNMLRYLEVSKIVDSDLVRTITEMSEVEEIVEKVNSFVEEFAREEITVALENHENLTTDQLVSIVQQVDNPYFGICLDTANSFGRAECVYTVVEKLLPYAVNIHVKDFEIFRLESMMGFKIVGRPVGEGRLNVKSLLEKVEGTGNDVNLIVEHWPPFSGNIKETARKEKRWAKKSISNLRSLPPFS